MMKKRNKFFNYLKPCVFYTLHFTLFTFFFFLTYSYAVFEYKEVFANTAGLCGAYSAEDRSPVTVYYNPAGLFNIPKYSFYFSNTNLYGMDKLANNVICFATDIKFLGRIGLLYNNFGFDLYKENFLTFAYANSVANKVSLGIGIKNLSVNVKNYGGKSFTSIDFGVISKLTSKILLGFVVKDFNIPEIAKDEKIYHTLVATGKIQPVKDVVTYVDVIKQSNEDIFCRVGENVKLNLTKQLSGFIRAGVETATQNKPSKYSVGVGVGYNIGNTEFVIDYSCFIHTMLGSQHLFGLNINFGKKEEVFEEPIKRRKISTRDFIPTQQVPSKLININTATAEELAQLPGVGMSTAQKIVEYRQQIGGFTSVEQLLDVPRIGTVTLQRIRPYITLGQTETQRQEKKVEKPKKTVDDEEVIKKEPLIKPSEEISPQQQTPQQFAPQQLVPQQKETKEKYNLNTISVEELEKLGFSSNDAKNIVRYRIRFGKFKSVDELYKVPNINYEMVDKIKPVLITE